MFEWAATGICLLWLWTKAVGLPESIHGCAWVIVRKLFPRQESWAKAMIPRLRTVEVHIPGHPYPFYARWPASDLHILYTIVQRKEYAPLDSYLDGKQDILFLDLGANIGAASRYFLDSYPTSRVVAVEPASANIAMCRMNLAPYGDRVRLIEAAVWNRTTRLVFDRMTTQPGTEAGIRLREPVPGEEAVDSINAVDISTLLSESSRIPQTQVAVKMDIEGSEEAIFRGPSPPWLDEVCCIAIELHDSVQPNCSRNFFSALEGRLQEPTRKIGDTVFARLSGCSHSTGTP
jgi:FkbM family methyltransferase